MRRITMCSRVPRPRRIQPSLQHLAHLRWSSGKSDTSNGATERSPRYPNGGGNNHIQPTSATRELLRNIRKDNDEEESPQNARMRRRMALAKAITLVESKASRHQQQADWLLTNLLETTVKEDSPTATVRNRSFRLGLAGPPGAGKSTFIEAFGMYLLNRPGTMTTAATRADDVQQDTVDDLPSKMAVVAIDPSSNVTGGSILGDKTRMMELSRHDRAFVRPSANGGTFGGLSAYTDDVVSLCQAAGYDLVIVESVGLGQSEVEIAESVDMLVLMVPPGGGDELQGVKKGIVEVADMLVVNKADGTLLPAARSTAADYRGAMKFLRPRTEHWKTPVVLASAHTRHNLDKVWNEICKFRRLSEKTGEMEAKRKRQGSYWMWKHLKDLISRRTRRDPHLRSTAEAMEKGLERGTVTPRVAALKLLERLLDPGVNKTDEE